MKMWSRGAGTGSELNEVTFHFLPATVWHLVPECHPILGVSEVIQIDSRRAGTTSDYFVYASQEFAHSRCFFNKENGLWSRAEMNLSLSAITHQF